MVDSKINTEQRGFNREFQEAEPGKARIWQRDPGLFDKVKSLEDGQGTVDGFISRTQGVDVYEGEDRVQRTTSRERVGMMRRDRSVSRGRRRSTSRGRLGERRSVLRERYRTRNQRRSALEKDQAQGDQLCEGVLGGHHQEVA